MESIFKYQNYRDILKSEFMKRRERNASYSQRAFARDLGITVNRISEILNGKQGLSAKTAESVAEKLGLSPIDTKYFKALVIASDGRSQFDREVANEKIKHLNAKSILSFGAVNNKKQVSFSSPLITISADRIDEVKKRINDFCKTLSDDLAKNSDDRNTYSLTIQLFNLTQES